MLDITWRKQSLPFCEGTAFFLDSLQVSGLGSVWPWVQLKAHETLWGFCNWFLWVYLGLGAYLLYLKKYLSGSSIIHYIENSGRKLFTKAICSGIKKSRYNKPFPLQQSPFHFLTVSPPFISEPLMIQWVMRTQWWRRKYLSTFQTHSNFVGLKCTYRPEAGQNLLCFLLRFFRIIQAAPEAWEPHPSEPWHHHNMDMVVHVEEVPLLLSAKWQVSNVNITANPPLL